MTARRRYNSIFKRFVWRTLDIDSIKNEELYVLAWMADLFFLVYAFGHVLGGRYGRYLVYSLASVGLLVFLVWYGKTRGQKEDRRLQAHIPLSLDFIITSVVLSKKNLAKLEKMKVDVENLVEFSLFINEMLDG